MDALKFILFFLAVMVVGLILLAVLNGDIGTCSDLGCISDRY